MATRPRVLLSCAMSIDGYDDDTAEQRLILSSGADWDRVDGLRAWADAILIGAGTLRSDNPAYGCAPRNYAPSAVHRAGPSLPCASC